MDDYFKDISCLKGKAKISNQLLNEWIIDYNENFKLKNLNAILVDFAT